LGHATRCIPLIRQYMAQGHEVVLGGDGESLMLLRKTFPELRAIDLPSLELRYAENAKQRGFYLCAIPALIRFTIADHYYLRQQLAIEHFDRVISDNRFGLFSRQTYSIYMTHQLYVQLPKRLKIFEPLARAIHACIYKRYKEVWVPDYADTENNLAGDLAHGGCFDRRARYIGPLSRFGSSEAGVQPVALGVHNPASEYPIMAVLSGLEPQRTLFEQELVARFKESQQPVLIVRGKIGGPATATHVGAVTLLPHISDEELLPLLQQADKIIVRSGYSTIMDLAVLGLLHKAEFHPTPGQSEQEYLASKFS
jgi:UDP:flavonoid glycosyltransferase YjiC (YdhE family)